ncbi:nucleoside phosphorylase/phosphoribosyltransferase catalytic domain-containing protein [Leucogyrophana mollusca]|uniref:Nucleoside phosphorylase/phosphoribosyltransferase catalytic domain-containing protein n=1 Tax=Leucogyrophana mollusca TaxID=85980 RepID=A0ACB8BS36_9AGAM|nr:nucleoside phosphorylase/phosphoribosyltransferase catalytic domain-containing protein [Leucogyrophana mollusca]
MIAPYRKALPFRSLLDVLGPLINPACPKGMVLGVAVRGLGDTWVRELRDDGAATVTLHPEHLGLDVHPLSSVAGGTPKAEAFKALPSGFDIPVHLTPVLHFVLMNTSALLLVVGLAMDYKDGVRLAMESIALGKAWKALETVRDAAHYGGSKA